MLGAIILGVAFITVLIAFSHGINAEDAEPGNDRYLVIESFTNEGLPFVVPYVYATDMEGEPFKLSFKQENGSLMCPLLDVSCLLLPYGTQKALALLR